MKVNPNIYNYQINILDINNMITVSLREQLFCVRTQQWRKQNKGQTLLVQLLITIIFYDECYICHT